MLWRGGLVLKKKTTAKQSFILDLIKKGYKNHEIAKLVPCSPVYVSLVRKQSQTPDLPPGNPFIHPTNDKQFWPVDTVAWDSLCTRLLPLEIAWEDSYRCRIGCVICSIEWSYLKTSTAAEKWYTNHNNKFH